MHSSINSALTYSLSHCFKLMLHVTLHVFSLALLNQNQFFTFQKLVHRVHPIQCEYYIFIFIFDIFILLCNEMKEYNYVLFRDAKDADWEELRYC